MLKASVLLPAGNGKYPDPILVDDYEDIQREVGGTFTTVALTGSLKDSPINLIGFAPDSVPEPTENDMNWYASALFGQQVWGPCVVAWGLSPNGNNDGDIYDMPDFVSEYIFGEFTQFVIRAYGEAHMMGNMFREAVAAGIITETDLDRLMDYVEALTNDATDEYEDFEKVHFMRLLNAVEGFILGRAAEEFAEGMGDE